MLLEDDSQMSGTPGFLRSDRFSTAAPDQQDSGVLCFQKSQDGKQRRLSTARRTGDRDGLSSGDIEVDVFEGSNESSIERLAQPPGSECRTGLYRLVRGS